MKNLSEDRGGMFISYPAKKLTCDECCKCHFQLYNQEEMVVVHYRQLRNPGSGSGICPGSSVNTLVFVVRTMYKGNFTLIYQPIQHLSARSAFVPRKTCGCGKSATNALCNFSLVVIKF